MNLAISKRNQSNCFKTSRNKLLIPKQVALTDTDYETHSITPDFFATESKQTSYIVIVKKNP